MLSEQNNIVKQQILNQNPKYSQKQNLIQYFMAYDYPQKQKYMKNWWQIFISNIINKKRQIYITYKDLYDISSLFGLKPLPLQSMIKQLYVDKIFITEEQLYQKKIIVAKVNNNQNNPISNNKNKVSQKLQSSWFVYVMNKFGLMKQQKKIQFTFKQQEKIISTKIKQKKMIQLKSILITYAEKHQHAKLGQQFIRQLSNKLLIDETSVHLLLQQLKANEQVIYQKTKQLQNLIIFSMQKQQLKNQSFIKVQSIKYQLRSKVKNFQIKYEKSTAQIGILKSKAKKALQKCDKHKARAILMNVKSHQEHRENIHLRKSALEEKIMHLEINQMNKSSYDLLKDAQQVYNKFSVDPEKFDEVIQRQQQIKMQLNETNKRFQQVVNNEQINEQVDKLLIQLQFQVSKSKQSNKNSHVQIEEKQGKSQKYQSLMKKNILLQDKFQLA